MLTERPSEWKVLADTEGGSGWSQEYFPEAPQMGQDICGNTKTSKTPTLQPQAGLVWAVEASKGQA